MSVAALPALSVGGREVELALSVVSARVLRLTVRALGRDGAAQPVPRSAALVAVDGAELLRVRRLTGHMRTDWGAYRVEVSAAPFRVAVQDRSGAERVALWLEEDGTIGFGLGRGPLLGLGQGGQQFDRRGAVFPPVNGQGEGDRSVDMNAPGARAPKAQFDLAGEGARITIPWLASTDGWGAYFHAPAGVFDLSGGQGVLRPEGAALPVDAFLVVAEDPCELLRGYAEITGFPHLPPLWSLGYLQSHRTLLSPEEILDEAQEFRRRALPCDGMIYLGTGFCRDGWNTGHGAFAYNPRMFPEPAAMLDALHAAGMRVVLHVVDPPVALHGTLAETDPADPDGVAAYWRAHAPADTAGVDGWWPDVGDMLDPEARLARIRMYWDGPLADHPDRRPFALHRNAFAGVQRYGWVWSGDIDSAWRTLAMQVPVGLNCGLTGIPFWGTDTGGFVTRRELTGELFVRWFQFSTFCPSFRGHGRTWKLRLPWGWNTGEFGPEEFDGRRVELPDASELHNAAVEPICRQYLELRYRLLPYTYSAVRETTETGLPVMRPLWLHYPDDPAAARCGDAYLWGRDILVAPVVEQGASARRVVLPPGFWLDFWTGERIAGGREIVRPVDLATLPLYVRAGAVIPTGRVRQHVGEASDEPLTLTIYPGADGAYLLYEDDGESLAHRQGAWQKFRLTWQDAGRRLGIALAEGSAPMAAPRHFLVTVRGESPREARFDGEALTMVV